MPEIKEIEISIYRQGQSDRIAMCPIQITPDPSNNQGLLEYNQDEICAAITAAVGADRPHTTIAEITVQNPFTSGEVWEALFADGVREKYVIEYE